MYYLGIDHHKKYSQVVVLNQEGTHIMQQKMANTKPAFQRLKQSLDSRAASAVSSQYTSVIEASLGWGALYDVLDELALHPVVANPLKVRAIADAFIKTDTIDATTLAQLLRTHLIPKVYVPAKEVREQKNILRYRFWLVKLQTMVKNRIYDLLNRNHIEVPEGLNLFSNPGKVFLDSLMLSTSEQRLLQEQRNLLTVLSRDIKATELWIKEVFQNHPGLIILDSLPGFGTILSALAALEIDTIDRFPTPAKFASYCGLIPSTYARGGKIYHGDLIPTANKWLKYVFIEAAWTATRCSGYCQAYLHRIKAAKGANVAIVALARRLSEIAFYCLKEHRLYEERPYRPVV